MTWDVDEGNRDRDLKALALRCPGVDDFTLEDIIDNIDVADEPLETASRDWYAIIEIGMQAGIYGGDTREELAKTIIEDVILKEKDFGWEIIEVFHDGKKVDWHLMMYIGD